MNSKHTPGPWVASLDKSRPALPLWLIGAPVSAELPAEAPRHIGNVYAEANARLIAEAPAMLAALRWALSALEKCPPPKEKRGNLDTVAAGAWHGRARGDIQRILARIDGEPAPSAQPAGAIGEAGPAKREKPVCRECGGDSVVQDAAVRWNVETQQYEASDPYDKSAYCDDCDGETRLSWVTVDADGNPTGGEA